MIEERYRLGFMASPIGIYGGQNGNGENFIPVALLPIVSVISSSLRICSFIQLFIQLFIQMFTCFLYNIILATERPDTNRA